MVGDDDQSIYRFRGAEVRNILEFPERFPPTDIIRLERNYRSTAPILSLAASVVDHNRGRLGKTLRSERGAGKKPVLAFLPDQDEEARFCAELIVKSPARYSHWALLYRTNAQSLSLETELIRRGIPYRLVGSLKFYEREEVKDALALLSFLVNPRDEVAFRRVVNKPSRGVGPATVDRIVEAAREGPEPGNLTRAAEKLLPELSAKAASGIKVFLQVMEKGRAALKGSADRSVAGGAGKTGEGPLKTEPGLKTHRDREKPAGEFDFSDEAPVSVAPPAVRENLSAGEGLSLCVVSLAWESGIAEYHRTHDEIVGNQRLGNLQELANAASVYPPSREGLLEFLENIELDRSIEEDSTGARNDAVTLITIHNTKGLEFRRVIITGVEEGIFPREGKKEEDLEEERRLFYVGATRAMDELYITSCAMRRMRGRTMPMEPSVFLREIDRASVKIIGVFPPGFAGEIRSPLPGPSAVRTGPASSDGRWRVGDRVFHDDRGYGEVIRLQEGDEGPVITVRFETGYESRFLSLYQSSSFTKIGYD